MFRQRQPRERYELFRGLLMVGNLTLNQGMCGSIPTRGANFGWSSNW